MSLPDVTVDGILRSACRNLAVLATIVTAIAGNARTLTAQTDEGITVGAAAPTTVVADLAGHRVQLTPGGGAASPSRVTQPMLIEFWATWCEFCERLEPTMRSVYAKYGARVQFAAIAVNVNQSVTRVARHVQARNLAYPVYYDVSGAATSAFEVAATSFVVVIDRSGKVVYTGVGDQQDLDAAIRRALASK
jgi:thiol-disulfide isomerase/thioredoxin